MLRMFINGAILLMTLLHRGLMVCDATKSRMKGDHQNKPSENRRVLLISLDGFGWDYMDKTLTPNLDYIAKTGVQAKYLRSSFPTTTYPNHFTLVTGLYPESHGIIANYMRDPKLPNETFNIFNNDSKWWSAFGAVPLWITNQEQGGISAVIHWPGYNVRFKGKSPDFNLLSPSFNIDLRNKTGRVVSIEKRINLLMKWLSSENPPNFIAMYYEEPDEVGHSYGPNSREIKRMIRKTDHVLGILLKRLRDKGMLDNTNIIVTSDHGMTETSSSRQIFVDKYVDPDTYDIWDASTNLMISPHRGHKEDIYKKFKEVPHVRVYRKEEIPEYLHFSRNRRVPEIFVLADEGWTITRGKTHGKPNEHWIRGNHGFSIEYKSQRGFFVGRGSAFRVGYKAKGFDNVNIYSLVCRLLGVKPRPNNGTIEGIKHMLKPDFNG